MNSPKMIHPLLVKPTINRQSPPLRPSTSLDGLENVTEPPQLDTFLRRPRTRHSDSSVTPSKCIAGLRSLHLDKPLPPHPKCNPDHPVEFRFTIEQLPQTHQNDYIARPTDSVPSTNIGFIESYYCSRERPFVDVPPPLFADRLRRDNLDRAISPFDPTLKYPNNGSEMVDGSQQQQQQQQKHEEGSDNSWCSKKFRNDDQKDNDNDNHDKIEEKKKDKYENDVDDIDFTTALKAFVSEELYGINSAPMRPNLPAGTTSHFFRDKKSELFPELASPAGLVLQDADMLPGKRKRKTTTIADSCLEKVKESMFEFRQSIKCFSNNFRHPSHPKEEVELPSDSSFSSSSTFTSISSSSHEEKKSPYTPIHSHQSSQALVPPPPSAAESDSTNQHHNVTRPNSTNRQTKQLTFPITPCSQRYCSSMCMGPHESSSIPNSEHGGRASHILSEARRRLTESKADRRRAELKAQIKHVGPLNLRSTRFSAEKHLWYS